MTYRSYEARIQKIASVTKGIRRCAKLIVAVLLIAFVATGGYLFARGLVIGGVTCAPVVSYGDDMQPSAQVLFGSAVYEYAPEGSEEWTENIPIMPGRYQVRAVTKRSFGFVSRSNATLFTIQPRKTLVTILEAELPYGGTPTVTGDLREGDRVEASGLKYNNLTLNPTLIHIPQDNIRITNADGEDVTMAYEITTKDKVVDIVPRSITVTVPSVSKPYDGSPLTSVEWSISEGSLVEGDMLDLTFAASVTFVTEGAVENRPTIAGITNAEGKDIHTHYNVTLVCGTLKIEPYELTFATNSPDPWMYGFPAAELKIEGELTLPAGHTYSQTFTPPTDVGSYDNICTLQILNQAGAPVSEENFNWHPTWGKITIEPRPIILTTPDASKVYDGKALSKRKVTPKTMQTYFMLEGHTISISESTVAELTDVGSIENKLDVQILDAGGEDVTGNYTLTFEYGTLSVTPKPLVITSGSAEKEYDGLPLTCDKVENADGLLEGHSISVLDSTSVTMVEGIVKNEFFEIKITDESGRDINPNYEISYNTNTPGTLQILPRPLSVQTPDGVFDYDGTAHSITEGIGLSNKDLLDGYTFEVEDVTTVTDATPQPVENRVTILVFNEAGDDVTSCFAIRYTYGELRVNPRKLLVTSGNSAEDPFIYDGQEHTLDQAILLERDGALLPVEGHTVILVTEGFLTIPGQTENKILSATVVDGAGKDVTANYAIQTENGQLYMVPRPITLTAGSAEDIYNGQALTNSADPVVSSSLAISLLDGHTAKAVMEGSIVNVGTVDNVIVDYEIRDKGGNDVTAYYDVTRESGSLTVLPREITLQMSDATQVYNDSALTCPLFDITSEIKVVEGQMLIVESSSSIIEVGETANELLGYRIEDGSGADVTENYSVTAIDGSLTVTQRPLKITTGSATKRYDGFILECQTFTTDGLIAGHTIQVLESTQLIKASADPLDNQFDLIQITRDSDGADVMENYAISYEYGTLSVTKYPLVISTPDRTFIYDGKPHSAVDDITVELPEGHTLLPVEGAIITDVGTQTNTVVEESIKITNADGEDVTDCFAIKDTGKGTLTVNKRPITICPLGDSRHYNRSPLTCREYVLTGEYSLVEGHTLILPENGYKSQTEVGSTKNTFPENNGQNYRVINGETDVTANYAITIDHENCGNLEVTRIPLTIVSDSYEKVYDGTPLNHSVYQTTPLNAVLDGHQLEVIFTGTQTDVGTSANKFTYRVMNGSVEVTDTYYDIQTDFGTLEVTARPITITTSTASKTYDGTPLSAPNEWTASGLVTGHTFMVTNTTEITNVGTISNALKEESGTLVIEDAEHKDVTANYAPSYSYGTLTVTPIQLDVQMGSSTKEYDGSPCENHGVTQPTNMLSGHTLVVTGSSYTNAGTYDNELVDWYIAVDGARADDMKKNYVIGTVTKGTLTVTQKSVTITAGSAEYNYTGAEQSCTTYTADGLLPGHIVEPQEYTKAVYADVYVNVFESVRILNGTDDVTDNYAITLENGTLTIHVVYESITISPSWIQLTYTGQDLSPKPDDFWISAGSLPPGYTVTNVTYEVEGSKFNAGEHTSYVTGCTILDPQGNDVTADMTITYGSNDLIILPQEVVILTGSLTAKFDGTTHRNPDWQIVGGVLLDGHTLDVSITQGITNRGSVYNVVDSMTITDADGNVMISGTSGDENNFLTEIVDGVTYHYEVFKSEENPSYQVKIRYGVLTVNWGG